MTYRTLRNAGVASITALALALVACGGSSSSTTPPAPIDLAPTTPVFSGPAAGVTDHQYIVNVSSSDPEGKPVTFSATATGGTVTVAGNVLTVKPTAAGTLTLNVTANDGAKTTVATWGMPVTANADPVLPKAATTLAFGGRESIALAGRDADNDVVTYTILGGADTTFTGASLNGNALELNAAGVAAGTYKVSVKATQSGNNLVASKDTTLVLNITVLAQPNLPPTNVLIQGPASVVQNHTATYLLSASDPEGLPVAFSKKNEADPYTIVGNVLTFTPAAAGNQAITVVAKDSANQTAEQTLTVVVTANRAPVMTLPGSVTMEAATERTLPLGPDRDADNDPITYTSADKPAFVTILGNQLNIKPAKADGGQTYNFTVTGTDGFGGTTNTAVVLVVNPAAIVFNVTNVTQPEPAKLYAGRTYPNDAKPRATSGDLYNNRFTAYCDYPVTATDELTWSFIYNGTTIQEQKTTGSNGATTGAFVEFSPIKIPLTDFGATRFYSVQVQDSKGNIARSNLYPVTPKAPNFAYVKEVKLNDVRGLRTDGLKPIWNAPAANAALTWPAQFIDLTLTADDVFAPGGDGLKPFKFTNPKAFIAGTTTALTGVLTLADSSTAVDNTSAVLTYTPSQADLTKIPYFTVDVTNSAGMTTTVKIEGLIAAAANLNVKKEFDGTGLPNPKTTETLGFDAGKNLIAVRENRAPGIAVVPGAGPATVAGEEGSTAYKVVDGVNMNISDVDVTPGVNRDFLDTVGVLPLDFPKLPNPNSKSGASGYLLAPAYTQMNGDEVDTSEKSIKFSRAPYTLIWNPIDHKDVRKELGFNVKPADLYDAVSATGLNWVAQIAAPITGFKLDTVVGGTLAGNQFDTALTGVTPTARKIHLYPVHSKATVGAVASQVYPYAAGAAYVADADLSATTGASAAPSEFGILSTATHGIYVTPMTNPASGAMAYFTSRGINGDNAAGLTPLASDNVVPYGYYLVKIDDTRTGLRPVDFKNRYFFTNTTGGYQSGAPAPDPDSLDLSKTYLGRDMADATTAPTTLGLNADLRISTLNGLTLWDNKRSALQFSIPKGSKGNVFLSIGTSASTTNVLSTAALQLPFPTIHSTQNIAKPGVAAGALPANSPIVDGSTGTSSGDLVADFDGLVPNVAGATPDAIIITQLAPKDIPAGAVTIKGMAVTKTISPSPSPLPVITAGGIVDYLNMNTSAATAASDSWYTNIKRSAFYNALANTGGVTAAPANYAAYNNEFFGVFFAHLGYADAFEQNAALLLNFQNLKDATGTAVSAPVANGADLDLGSLTFGNPWTSSASAYKVAQYFIQSAVAVSDGTNAPAAGPAVGDYGTLAKVGYVTNAAAAPGADGGYAPTITPVTGVKFYYTKAVVAPDTTVTVVNVDVANRQTPTGVVNANAVAHGQGTPANGTAAFTLSWNKPTNYSGADVEIWSYVGAGAATKLTTVTTGGTSIKIPTTLMPAGSSYFFRIRAYNIPGVNFNITPLKRALPFGYADFVTQAIPMT